jgi:DNA helicase-2/ATP-dependent DNA helicase PcrA
MTHTALLSDDNHVDDGVDDQIKRFLDLKRPVSFFLFAGAGSGKTRSLINALNFLRESSGPHLRLYGKRIGVITYTNAACDEIKRRIRFDPLFEVSTIHSFVWSLISGHHLDIKRWLRTKLETRIAELHEEQHRGRPGTKAALEREASIKSKQRRLSNLDWVKHFTYNPVGDNRGRDSLNHSEVIEIGADFLTDKPVMQRILIDRFPILLIDESQDTNKLLMEAFLKLQAKYKDQFCLGLVGDVMQRIYADGKVDLGRELPADWVKPAKKLNHRCPRRIIKLINKIRSEADDHLQVPRSDSEEGFVRLFVLPGGTLDKPKAELLVAEKMALLTGDELWRSEAHVKHLMLEHHMVAKRMGFLEMFAPLYAVDSLQTGLREGALPGLRFFSQLILPLVKANKRGDAFAVAAIVRKDSPLLNSATLKAAGTDQQRQLQNAHDAVKKLMDLFSGTLSPRFLDVLQWASRTRLFEIPDCFHPITEQVGSETPQVFDEEEDDPILKAWNEFLLAPFAQIEPYDEYVSGRAPFETHQGVKGLEFERVMVIMDDTEARGFMFSYEKLFGAKDKSKTDLEHKLAGTDSSIDRTRRLFYVTCSRAMKSLALVAYSGSPERVKGYVIHEGWFEKDEVEVGG